MDSPTAVTPVTLTRVLCAALVVGEVVRLLQIAPRWIAGTPPAFPGQYESRLLSALVGVGILGAVLVGQSGSRHTTRGRIAHWGLLGAACVVFAAQMIVDR